MVEGAKGRLALSRSSAARTFSARNASAAAAARQSVGARCNTAFRTLDKAQVLHPWASARRKRLTSQQRRGTRGA